MDRASLDEPARGELLSWLGDQLEEERFAQLDRAGHDPNDRIPLARVLVDLPIARSPLAEKKDDAATKDVLAALCQEDPELFQRLPTSPQRGARDPLEIEDMVDPGVDKGCAVGDTTGIVLVGGPGQGKSTITQSLCALHHAAWLSPHTDRLSVPASEAVESIAAAQRRVAAPEGAQGSESIGRHEDFQSSAPPLPAPATLRFPLRIVLPEAAAWLHSRKGTAVEMFPALLFFAAERAANVPVAVATLAAILGQTDWLLILDGLDEVPPSEARSAVLSAARALIDWLRERRRSGLVVATTRPQGYSGELDRWTELQTWYLLPLGVADARKYAGHLVRARYDGKRGERILTRLSEAAASAATARLLRTPLQTTILVALIARIGRAPGERWSLFSEYYRIIYEREMERDLPAAELLRRYRPFIDRIHAHVGLLLQVEAELSEGTDATMTPARLRDVMHAVFAEQGMDAARRQGIIEELLKAITERLVLLVERRAGHVGFEIRPLQEMMAAWALGQKEGLIEERLLRVAKSDAHREVVLFIASKAFAELSDVRDVLVDRLLPALNEDPEEPLAAQVLRGSVLAIDILRDGAVLSQPKYVERLCEIAARLLKLPPSELLPRLAKASMADSDGAAVAAPLLLEIIRGTFARSPSSEESLSAWCLLIGLVDAGSEVARRLADEHVDALVPQLDALAIVLRTARVVESSWLQQVVLRNVEDLDPDTSIVLLGGLDVPLANGLRTLRGLKRVSAAVGWSPRPLLCLTQWCCIDQSLKGLDSISTLAPRNPSLHMHVAAARFLLAPTADSLACALEYLSEHGTSPGRTARPAALPWPLAACLASTKTTEDFHALARRARAGDLGSTDDWRKAEKRRGEEMRINPSALLRTVDFDWLVDVNDAHLPFSAAHIMPIILADLGSQPEEDAAVQATLDHLRNPALASFVALPIAQGLFQYLASRGEARRPLPLPLEDVRLLWRLSERTPLSAVAAARSTSETDSWLDLVDEIGRSGRFSIGVTPLPTSLGELGELIVRGIEENPKRSGLLRILERPEAADLSEMLSPSCLQAERYSETRDKLSVFLIRLLRGEASEEDVVFASQTLLTPGETQSRYWQYLREAPRGKGVKRALLRGMLQDAGAQSRRIRPFVLIDARANLGQTPTGLDDPAVWDTLQLPMPRPERRTVSDRAPEPPAERRPIAIDELSLRNFRGVQELQLKPSPPDNGHGQWIILLGQNGLGKTTLLRALALSLFDLEDPVRRPLPPTAYNSAWRRIGASRDDPAFVRLRLRGKELEHGVDLRPRDDLLWRESLRAVAAPPVEEMVFAYGVRRRYLVSDLSRAVGPELHALVPSLFEEGADLLPIEESLAPLESAWHTQPESVEGRIHVELRAALKELLRVDEIERRGQELWVRGKNTGDVPLKELSDGYLTLASWVVDVVLRWWHQAKRWKIEPAKSVLESMTGLVLIDEIDLFLHPDWQRSVVKTLKKLLPRMSFVVTTHNPLAILGARANEIWILRRGEGSTIVAEQRDQEPFRLTGSDLYDLFFGIESTLPDEIGQMLYRYRQLASDPYRSPAEDAEANKLLSDLREREMDPGYEPMPLEKIPPMPEDLA